MKKIFLVFIILICSLPIVGFSYSYFLEWQVEKDSKILNGEQISLTEKNKYTFQFKKYSNDNTHFFIKIIYPELYIDSKVIQGKLSEYKNEERETTIKNYRDKIANELKVKILLKNNKNQEILNKFVPEKYGDDFKEKYGYFPSYPYDIDIPTSDFGEAYTLIDIGWLYPEKSNSDQYNLALEITDPTLIEQARNAELLSSTFSKDSFLGFTFIRIISIIGLIIAGFLSLVFILIKFLKNRKRYLI